MADLGVEHNEGLSKIVTLYRKLTTALDLVEGTVDDGGDETGTAIDLATHIRELSVELEQLADNDSDTSDGGDEMSLAARIRTIEREISTLLSRVQNFTRRQHNTKEDGWAH